MKIKNWRSLFEMSRTNLTLKKIREEKMRKKFIHSMKESKIHITCEVFWLWNIQVNDEIKLMTPNKGMQSIKIIYYWKKCLARFRNSFGMNKLWNLKIKVSCTGFLSKCRNQIWIQRELKSSSKEATKFFNSFNIQWTEEYSLSIL